MTWLPDFNRFITCGTITDDIFVIEDNSNDCHSLATRH